MMNISRASLALSLLLVAPLATAEKLVVHEWGVQVLGTAHDTAILAPPGELIEGLPRFVGRNEVPVKFTAQGWDKPVLHFYGAEGTRVRVRVSTATGAPLAYYPVPILTKGELFGGSGKRMLAGILNYAAGMEWEGTLRGAKPVSVPDA